MADPPAASFSEVQRFTQKWVWVLVVVVAGVVCVSVVAATSAGDSGTHAWVPLLGAAAVGVGIPLLFAVARLTIEVDADAIEIRYRPFMRRTIRLDSVAAVDAVTYNPLRDYGGWGIRGWSRRKVAYNISGDRGVLLTLADGATVLLGSQRPEELAAAVRAALQARS